MAEQAELFFLTLLPLDETERERQERRIRDRQKGDVGFDAEYRGRTIDVKWSPCRPFPPYRCVPQLKVAAWRPMKADLYAAVHGRIIDELKCYGFATLAEVRAAPRQDFGWQRPDGRRAPMFVLDLIELHLLDELFE